MKRLNIMILKMFTDDYGSEQASTLDCKWNDYTPWSKCSKTCGTGTRKRERTVIQEAKNGGKECKGLSIETDNCTLPSCVETATQGRLKFL